MARLTLRWPVTGMLVLYIAASWRYGFHQGAG